MRMRAWEGVLAGRPYACALTTVSMTALPTLEIRSRFGMTNHCKKTLIMISRKVSCIEKLSKYQCFCVSCVCMCVRACACVCVRVRVYLFVPVCRSLAQ